MKKFESNNHEKIIERRMGSYIINKSAAISIKK